MPDNFELIATPLALAGLLYLLRVGVGQRVTKAVLAEEVVKLPHDMMAVAMSFLVGHSLVTGNEVTGRVLLAVAITIMVWLIVKVGSEALDEGRYWRVGLSSLISLPVSGISLITTSLLVLGAAK